MFIIWKLEWLKILFELTSKKEIITALLEYNCFDYFFQSLFVNVTVSVLLWILTFFVLWIFLWILPTLKYYDSQGLNVRLKLIGGAMKYFFEKVTGPWNISSKSLWATKFFLKKIVKPSRPPLTYLMYTALFPRETWKK